MNDIYINNIKRLDQPSNLINLLKKDVYKVTFVVDELTDDWWDQFVEMVLYRNTHAVYVIIKVVIIWSEQLEYIRSQLLEMIRYYDIKIGKK